MSGVPASALRHKLNDRLMLLRHIGTAASSKTSGTLRNPARAAPPRGTGGRSRKIPVTGMSIRLRALLDQFSSPA
jgi:hypothetical protein